MRDQSLHRKKSFVASQTASRARGAQPGFEPNTTGMPDYLPMLLEFLALFQKRETPSYESSDWSMSVCRSTRSLRSSICIVRSSNCSERNCLCPGQSRLCNPERRNEGTRYQRAVSCLHLGMQAANTGERPYTLRLRRQEERILSPPSLLQIPGFCQAIQEQVKIEQPAIRVPLSNGSLYPGIIQRVGQAQPATQIIPGSHIVSREAMQPP